MLALVVRAIPEEGDKRRLGTLPVYEQLGRQDGERELRERFGETLPLRAEVRW